MLKNLSLAVCASLLLSIFVMAEAEMPFAEITLSPSVKVAAEVGGRVSMKPFTGEASANALIVRCRLMDGRNYTLPVKARLLCGELTLEREMLPINWMFNHGDTDYELPLGEIVQLNSETTLELAFALEPGQQMEIYGIMPVVFRSDDLSRGIDFETAETTGVWVGHENGAVKMDETRGLSGRRCLRADWPANNSMVSLLPGERNWKKYAALRLTLANPLPGADGHRTRVCFLYDGKTVQRPDPNDSISSGALVVVSEGVKTFQLDLRRFARNNPKFDLRNVRSFQIFWSPVANGPAVFYIDDVMLLTAEQLKAEEDAKYLGRIDAIEAESASTELKEVVADLRWRYAAGERASLDRLLDQVKEMSVMEALSSGGEKELMLSWAPATTKIMRDEKPLLSPFPARISAAGNERESFQLVMAPMKPLKNVTVSSSGLVSEKGDTLPASAVTVNPIAYLEVTSNAFAYKNARPGMWPDVLLDNAPFDLPKRLQPYMITLAVPSGQPAGIYLGKLTICADGLKAREVEYQCRVYGFSLPVKGEMKTWFSMAFVPTDRELRKQHYDMFFDYRLNPVSMYNVINRNLPEYAKYACIPAVEDLPYCLSRGLNYLPFGYLYDYVCAATPEFRGQGWNFQDAYIQDVIDVVRAIRPLLQEAGAWDIAHINGFDEIMHKPAVRNARMKAALKICRALKTEFPDLKIANIGKLMTIDNSLMDTWFMSPVVHQEFEDVQKKGGFVGFYWAYREPSFMLDQPGIAPRLCAWLTYKEGACGMGYYSTLRPHDVFPDRKASLVNHPKPLHSRCCEKCMMENPPSGLDWTLDVYKHTGREGRNCDGKLFHPARGGRILASQRLVNIRDGIEDFEYFKMLEKMPGDHHALLTIGDEIITVLQGDYTTDYAIIEARREAVAKAIEAAIK